MSTDAAGPVTNATVSEIDAPGLGGTLRKAIWQLATALALALVAFLWGGTFLYLSLDREKSLQGAINNTGNMARVFEEHVDSAFKNIDQTLLFLRNSYREDPEGFDLPTWTASNYLLHDLILQISLIGKDGMLLTTNIVRNPDHVDLSDREHFKVHVGTNADRPFISKPVLGRASGKWSVQLTRRVSQADGSFGGVLVASIDPFYLSGFFDQIDVGTEGNIMLLGTDGLVRARGGLNTDVLGKSILATPLQTAIAGGTSGVFTGVDPFSGTRQVISYRRLDGFPLVVTVSMAEDEVLASYYQTRRLFLGTAAALTLVLAGVMCIGLAHEIRLIRTQAAQAKSEAQVASKSHELMATLAHMSQGILMLDGNDRVRVANRRAHALLGLQDTLAAGDRLPDAARALLAWSHDAGAASPLTREVSVAGGTELELMSTPMPDGGVLHTVTDITARKRYELALADARDKAEAAARARTAFLATMSHEIRTPLNGVIGMTQLIEATDDVTERGEYIHTMQRSASHLLQIVEDVLDMSRLEADRVNLEAIAFDLGATVRSAIDIVSPRAREKNLTIGVTIAPDVPAQVIGDAGRLRQVLLNLVGNAVKFTEFGMVIVRVALDAQNCLQIRVQDTGVGIAPENIANLFLEFSQLDGSITRRFGGTGLGLAITRKLLEKMGGSLSVESQLGSGSTFQVTLPITACTREEVQPAAETTSPRTAAGSEAVEEAVWGHDVLLVEDDRVNTTVATRMLTRLGHRVTAAADGLEALEILEVARFDVILMDLMMPRLDGFSTIERIRASGKDYANTPIVVLSADALLEDRERAAALGANGYATKPVSRERLQEAIRNAVLDGASSTGAAPSAAEVPEGPPLFDRAALESLREQVGEEGFGDIMRLFLAETEDRLGNLARLEMNRAEAAREVHSIKSASATLGLMRLSHAAANLQARMMDIGDSDLRIGIAALQEAFEGGQSALRAAA